MKRFIVGLAVAGSIVFGLHLYAGTPGQDLVSPTAYCHLYQDPSGNMTFSDVSTGPLTMNQIVNPTNITLRKNIFFGTIGTSVSTTTTANSSQGNVFQAWLASGSVTGAAAEGSVLCSTTSQQNQLVTVNVCVAVKDLGTVVGVAQAAISTGNVVNVYSSGWVLALTTGTVNPGDALATSASSSGYLETRNSTGTVGISLGSGNSAGGTTKIKLK